MRGAQVPGVRRIGPVADADARPAGSVVHLEVETVEGPHAAFLEETDRCLHDVAVLNDRGSAD